MEKERNSFFVRGAPEKVALKLARLINGSNPDNTGTGVEKELDMSKFDFNTLAKTGLDVNSISKMFTVNLLHRNRLASELLMAFLGQQSGLRALVISFRSKPDICEVIPCYLEGLISPDNMNKAGLELVVNRQ